MTPAAPRDALAWAPPVTVAAFVVPIGAGLAGTLLPAFGYLPAIGGTAFGLDPWRTLFAHPGIATSIALTVGTGVGTTFLAVLVAFGFCAFVHDRPFARRVGAALAPLLATPHSALAIGFAFVVAPSGELVRAVSPWLTGWTTPPDMATVGDAAGVALVAGLLLKEVPWLILMIGGAMAQVPARAHLAIARALGYGPVEAWVKGVLPQVYPQVRLPIYAVLAFSLSVVDVALILGPGQPPPLAVLAMRWFADADIRFWFPAAAAACLQLALVVALIAAWRVAEKGVARAGRAWIVRGRRGGPVTVAAATLAAIALAMFALAVAALAGMGVWSLAARWRFPDALPQAWTTGNWMRQLYDLAGPAATTLAVGALSTALAAVLALACLEHEGRRAQRVGPRALWILYLPLLTPQIAFLFGAQVLLVGMGFDGTLAAVVWAHLVFVLPYLFLSLVDPWRALDPRYARAAASLGASRARIFFAVKLPILMRPILVACAVAFAVSAGLYLPTVFAGNGRMATLTTEAVTLASGADRRVIGVWGLVQAAFPLLVYLLATTLPARRPRSASE